MSFIQNYGQAQLFKRDWLFFLASIVLFAAIPNLDLYFTNLWWNPEQNFIYGNTPWVQLSYLIFSKAHFLYFGILILIIIKELIFFRFKSTITKNSLFIIIALLLGPGLVVNQVFKQNWGRARPNEIVQFGSTNIYSAPLEISNQCESNCSFVSGHASGGFFILTLAWALRRRRWFWIGLISGSIVGLGRILQGGHFLSDIVFAFWTVYFSSQITAAFFGIKAPGNDNGNDNSQLFKS